MKRKYGLIAVCNTCLSLTGGLVMAARIHHYMLTGHVLPFSRVYKINNVATPLNAVSLTAFSGGGSNRLRGSL